MFRKIFGTCYSFDLQKKNRKEWIFKHNSFLPLFSKPNNTGSTKFEGKRKETLNFDVNVG
jgi:hypothetical protein